MGPGVRRGWISGWVRWSGGVGWVRWVHGSGVGSGGVSSVFTKRFNTEPRRPGLRSSSTIRRRWPPSDRCACGCRFHERAEECRGVAEHHVAVVRPRWGRRVSKTYQLMPAVLSPPGRLQHPRPARSCHANQHFCRPSGSRHRVRVDNSPAGTSRRISCLANIGQQGAVRAPVLGHQARSAKGNNPKIRIKPALRARVLALSCDHETLSVLQLRTVRYRCSTLADVGGGNPTSGRSARRTAFVSLQRFGTLRPPVMPGTKVLAPSSPNVSPPSILRLGGAWALVSVAGFVIF